jgi:cell division protease FtsH
LNDLAKNMLLWVVIAVVLMSVFNNLDSNNTRSDTVSYSQFVQSVKTGQVASVVIIGREITGLTTSNEKFKTLSPETDNRSLIGELLDAKVEIKAETQENSLLMQIFISWFPFIL